MPSTITSRPWVNWPIFPKCIRPFFSIFWNVQYSEIFCPQLWLLQICKEIVGEIYKIINTVESKLCQWVPRLNAEHWCLWRCEVTWCIAMSSIFGHIVWHQTCLPHHPNLFNNVWCRAIWAHGDWNCDASIICTFGDDTVSCTLRNVTALFDISVSDNLI